MTFPSPAAFWRTACASLLLVSSDGASGQDSRFQVIRGDFDWHEAKADAESRGGHLATFTSEVEWNRAVGSIPPDLNTTNLWLGGYLSPTLPEPEGQWRWVTGEPWNFHRWGLGEPNNAGNEYFLHYVHLGGSAYWNSIASPDNGLRTLFYLLESSVPRLAEAQAQVVNGFVVGVTVMDGGGGYTSPPPITFIGADGTGATATAVLLNGVIIGIDIDSPGRGYPEGTTVNIQSPGPPPKLSVKTSHITVTMEVTTGCRYQLETSSDLNSWSPSGPPFKATGPSIDRIFEVGPVPQYFRIREIF